mgnify:CR=1 FL=1
MRLRVLYSFDSLPLHLLPRQLELVLQVEVGGRNEDVDVVYAAAEGLFDVRLRRPRQSADSSPQPLRGDPLHRLGLALRGYGEAGLDDVDAEPVELVGDGDLVLDGEGDPWGLLPIPQGRIQDPDSLWRMDLDLSHVPAQIELLLHFRHRTSLPLFPMHKLITIVSNRNCPAKSKANLNEEIDSDHA